jgi:hypothetical protein
MLVDNMVSSYLTVTRGSNPWSWEAKDRATWLSELSVLVGGGFFSFLDTFTFIRSKIPAYSK